MSKKYVLVKSYYGLGGDLCVLIGAMRLAQQTGRETLADWNGGFYGRVEDGRLINAFFDSPTFATSEVLDPQALTVYPAQWAGRVTLPPLSYVTGVDLTLSRPEEVPTGCDADCVVITRDSKLMHRKPEEFYASAQRLKPIDSIRGAVQGLHDRMNRARPSIGIHFRHGNGERKVVPPDPRWFRNRINARLRELGKAPSDINLFVATDCKGVLDYFKRHYPNTFASEKSYRQNGAGAMHVGRDDLDDAQKMSLAFEALIDMYALAECTYFIGSKGFFSLFVKLARGRKHTLLYEGTRLFNRYEVTDEYYPLKADPVLSPPLTQRRLHLDGLFIQLSATERELFFFDERFGAVSRTADAVSADEIDTIVRNVVARRTY